MPETQSVPTGAEIRQQREELGKKYGTVARRRRREVDRTNIRSAVAAVAYFATALLIEFWASGLISITAFNIGASRSYGSSVNVAYVWLLPQYVAIFIGAIGLAYIVKQGYYHRGLFGSVAGAMHEWESHIRDIRERDPNKIGMPLTHLLSLSMTVRRVAAHTYSWATVWGLMAVVSAFTLPSISHFINGPSTAIQCIAAPLVLGGLWIIYIWRGHICQWTFLPVPEILRQYLVLIYMERRDRGPEDAYLLADAKLNECVKYCPECYIDRRGKLVLLGDVEHPRDV